MSSNTYVVLKVPFKMSYSKIYTTQNMNILYKGTKQVFLWFLAGTQYGVV